MTGNMQILIKLNFIYLFIFFRLLNMINAQSGSYHDVMEEQEKTVPFARNIKKKIVEDLQGA